ncbi:MAG: PfkB family carbohydrate kinase [Candidatus Omnitrophica bacterium]|jgi:sugar/nucleoside kinase (ribokinase family)|nr:PfkB family carbohydrate kinase [Candidatus Omnitrophota bacterium]
MSILVLGTAALDTVKTPSGVRKKMLGGSAVHFSMSARLFTQVHLVAIVGCDFPGAYVDFLKRKGIILDSLLRASGKTFHWAGEYQKDMNAAITRKTELGVLAEFCPIITPEQRSIKNVFLANVDPDIQRSLLSRMNAPSLVALDSMNYWIQNKKQSLLKMLRRVDIYVANDQEARSLTGESNLSKASLALLRMGPKMVLVKKGEHGVIFCSDKYIFSLPAFPTRNVTDPTGAGDTFAGGFMGYLSAKKKLDDKTIKQALVYGTIVASFNVEAFGLEKTSRLNMKDLRCRLAKYRQIVLF